MPLGNVLQSLIALVAILMGAVLIQHLFRRANQPGVVGLILYGIAIGAGLAALPQPLRVELLPEAARSVIDAAGETGLLMLMFVVSIELRLYSKTGERSRPGLLLPAVIIPIAVCAAASWPFASQLVVPGGSSFHAWLFMGAALGVTAVPVLVLLTQDLKVPVQPVPPVALSISVMTDAVAWAMVTVLIMANADLKAVSMSDLGAGAALLVTVTLVLPRIIRRFFLNAEHSASLVVVMFGYALLGSAGTQMLGLHPAVGAVIAGLSFPPGVANHVSQQAVSTIADVLIPAFFVSSVLSVPLHLSDLLSRKSLVCLAVLTVAAFGSKLAVGLLAGKMLKWPLRYSGHLGALLNCRGVTQIAIAAVGLQAHLIGAYAFAMLFTLALVTTAVTAPLYRAIDRLGRPSASPATADADDMIAAGALPAGMRT